MKAFLCWFLLCGALLGAALLVNNLPRSTPRAAFNGGVMLVCAGFLAHICRRDKTQ
jgi:uncharacterized membrane protein YfcA